MRIKGQKGFTLIELILTIALMGIIGTLLLEVFIGVFLNVEMTNSYVRQQLTVNNVVNYITRDIMACSEFRVDAADKKIELKFPGGTGSKYWKFSNNALLYSTDNFTDVNKTKRIVEGIDVSQCKFVYDSVKKHVLLHVKPVNKYTIRYNNRNITKPFVVEFSVKYKKEI
ncbi:MAG: type II secretion system GspH family protein [Clostridia bacterium]|nr:type II secretion system GspH family protein [Clostridia bacterium]